MRGAIYSIYVPSLLPLMLCIRGTTITTGEHHGRRSCDASRRRRRHNIPFDGKEMAHSGGIIHLDGVSSNDYEGSSSGRGGAPPSGGRPEEGGSYPSSSGRGRGGTTTVVGRRRHPPTASMARWKVASLLALSSLAVALVRVNYLLVRELGPGGVVAGGGGGASAAALAFGGLVGTTTTRTTTAAPPPGNTTSSRSETEARRKRLAHLRIKVEEAREGVRTMRTMVGNLRRRREGKRRGIDARRPRVGEGGGDAGGGGGGGGGGRGSFPRLTCSPDVARVQAERLDRRFAEWWSHSACPDQAWMEAVMNEIFDDDDDDDQRRGGGGGGGGGGGTSSSSSSPYLMLDVGCNKGYASADFLDAISPGTGVNPASLVNAIRSVAKDTNARIDRDGGVCNDSKRRLNRDRKTQRTAVVHCFEPSPATYNMLKLARAKLMPDHDDDDDDDGGGGGGGGGGARWIIHNLGLHSEVGDMSWHPACANAVGDELCTIVPDGSMEGAITVPVVTVDRFLRDAYPDADEGGGGGVVHLLKIDAEGLDPAVLAGSKDLLTRSGAMLVTFEFNPRLSEKKENPHGMWGKGGNPRTDLLKVTKWLDKLGYDCYVDSRRVDDSERGKGIPEAPVLYRITDVLSPSSSLSSSPSASEAAE
ncbi:hypothetical protein ACHAW5_006981 [Stephanodiscus triporus]|uniref:Methyltransferase FkbM domain-containing protein n=1 Tax=Stephanodiscus triporus TaxID=2934178 RepID=A0ABD3NME7_9STRA